MRIIPLTAQSEYFQAAIALLNSYGLVTSDIADDNVTIWAGLDGQALVGTVGLERAGSIGLLRSLAIAPDYRRQGYASPLCDVVFTYAAKSDLASLYLLTETAAGFFAKIGFVEVDREDAPEDLRATSQFSGLCPASATVMVRD